MLAQVSIEFVTLFILLISIFSLVFYYNLEYFKDINERKILYEAKIIADSIAKEIDIAANIGNGYSRVFYVKNKILGYIDYDIIYSPYTVIIKWNNNYVESVTSVKEIVGKIEKGKNVIKNIDGVIYVN
ncbi:MAG: hypothetical protein QXI09_01120 [Candidatus Aenigmatarchaeota archaeon]